MRSGAQHTTSSSMTTTGAGMGGLQNFNSLPVKDTNGRNGNSSGNNNRISIEEDDIIPVKEVAPLSVPSAVVATSSCPPLPAKVVPAEKEILIVDKDFDDKIKSKKKKKKTNNHHIDGQAGLDFVLILFLLFGPQRDVSSAGRSAGLEAPAAIPKY